MTPTVYVVNLPHDTERMRGMAVQLADLCTDFEPVSAVFGRVIVDEITPFFESSGDFLIIHNWKRSWRITGNFPVYRSRLGTHPEVLQDFLHQVDSVRQRSCNEPFYCQTSCTARAAWPIRRRRGAQAGSTTASLDFQATFGARRPSRRARASWCFKA